jgi:hypothetical protein
MSDIFCPFFEGSVSALPVKFGGTGFIYEPYVATNLKVFSTEEVFIGLSG